MQGMIIDDSASHESCSRCYLSLTEHESSTSLAEGVGHCLSAGCSLGLGEDGEIVFASGKASVAIEGGEIGRKHRGRDFATVGAVADECVDQTRGFQWLDVRASVLRIGRKGSITYDDHLNSSTGACRAGFVLVRPAIRSQALKRELVVYRHGSGWNECNVCSCRKNKRDDSDLGCISGRNQSRCPSPKLSQHVLRRRSSGEQEESSR